MADPTTTSRLEDRRIKVLESFAILDTEAEAAFDRLTELAAAFYQSPIALVSLIDRDRQWFKSKVGIDASETPRSLAFCDHAIRGNDVFIVNDATQDPRFADNPLVTNDPAIRFYAGAPVITPDGYRLGTLCVIDRVSRPEFKAEDAEQLRLLADVVMSELELRLRNRQLQEAIEESHHIKSTLENAVSSLDEAFVYYDSNDQLVICNDAYRAYFPHSADFMVHGATYEHILRQGALRGEYDIPDDIDLEDWIKRRVALHQSGDTHWEQQLSSGRWLKIAERRTPDGGVVGFRVDITELKEANVQATRAIDAKASFLANMSHEIRTPINAVIGLSGLVLQSNLSGMQRDYIGKIQTAGKNLLGVLNNVLDFSKIDAGKLTIEAVDFNLHDVLTDVSTLLATQAAAKEIEVIFSIGYNVPAQVVGDSLRISQILTNLANNAIKFTKVGEVVVYVDILEWTDDTANIRFRVRDSGIGMNADQASKLFEAFHQADDSTSRTYGGTGLGLAICKRLVDSMDGSIQVDSTVGQGSIFTVVLPLQRSLNEDDSSYNFAVLSRDVRALVCDNNATTRDVLTSTLERFGMRTESADSGEAALKLIEASAETDPFGLLILDSSMPDGMTGLQTAQALRSTPGRPDLPIIMMSAPFEIDRTVNDEDQLTITGFVEKPISTTMLYDAVMAIFSPSDMLNMKSRSDGANDGPIKASAPGSRLLLAEDNELNQIVAVGILEGAGFQVDVADNGQEAVDKLLAAGPHFYGAILMDIQMPEVDGLSATRMIRDHPDFKFIPIIAMTAHALPEERVRCLEAGMNDHLAKPFDPRDLIIKLNAWLLLSPSTSEGLDSPLDPFRLATSAQDAPQPEVEFDLDQVAENLFLPVATIRPLVAQFVTTYDTFVDDLANDITTGDTESAHRRAHSLKGIAGTLLADDLAESVADLEIAMRTEDHIGQSRSTSTVSKDLAALIKAMKVSLENNAA